MPLAPSLFFMPFFAPENSINHHRQKEKAGHNTPPGLQNPWGSKLWGMTLGEQLFSTLGDKISVLIID